MFKLSQEEEERARRLHKESIVIDTCAAAPYWPTVWSQNMLNQLDDLIKKDASTPRIFDETIRMATKEIIDGELVEEYKEWWDTSGLDVGCATLGLVGDIPFSYENALREIALMTRRIDSLDWLVKATSAKDIMQAKEQGKRAVVINFQNTFHIGADLDKLDFFFNLGIRFITLTYNMRNLVGDGCTERTDAGLSYFGIQVIKRMNELGILVDLSHVGDRTIMDATEFSTKPVAFTHAFCRELYRHDRGKTDEQLKAVAQSNGYCSICVVPFFLTYEKKPSLDHFLNHVEHTIEIMGIDKVGVGTDWGAVYPKGLVSKLNEEVLQYGFRAEHGLDLGTNPEGFKDARDWPNITRGLVSRGYSDEEIKGILGGNFLRIFKEVVGK